jgi:antitoxin PrlF
MPTATMTSKGQITIPKAIRDTLRIDAGDRIAFRVREDGVVELQPETVDLMSLRGAVRTAVQGVTLDDMAEAIAAGAVDE